MWKTLLDATDAEPGQRVLDAGCGSGELVGLALLRGCEVAGTDLAPGMIELCRATNQLERATFHEASTEELPFPDASFDIVISSMSIHFCDDVDKAFRELRRVVKPGGRIGISAPKSRSLNVLQVFELAAEMVPEQARDMELPMMFAGDGVLAARFRELGFLDIAERVAEAPMIEDTFEQLWEAEKTWAPIARACAVVGEAAFLAAYRRRMKERTGDAAPTRLDLAYRIVRGVKPS
jgi:SAM-dependent methyltransferase